MLQDQIVAAINAGNAIPYVSNRFTLINQKYEHPNLF
jgi:hypothetical protein